MKVLVVVIRILKEQAMATKHREKKLKLWSWFILLLVNREVREMDVSRGNREDHYGHGAYYCRIIGLLNNWCQIGDKAYILGTAIHLLLESLHPRYKTGKQIVNN